MSKTMLKHLVQGEEGLSEDFKQESFNNLSKPLFNQKLLEQVNSKMQKNLKLKLKSDQDSISSRRLAKKNLPKRLMVI